MAKIKNFKNFILESVLVDIILDKINKEGKFSLSYDERTYLDQYSNNKVDKGLEQWLLNDEEETFYDDKKTLYNEFEDDEDLFNNREKLIRIISNSLNKKYFTNSADWGGGYAWNIKTNDNFLGTFLYLSNDNDELFLLKRTLINEDEYNDEILQNIQTSRDLYKVLRKIKKNEI